jgi:hypothetical protein
MAGPFSKGHGGPQMQSKSKEHMANNAWPSQPAQLYAMCKINARPNLALTPPKK